jgi:hypothetical protein
MALRANKRKTSSLFLAVDGTGMKYLSLIAEMVHGTEENNGRPIVN